MPATWKVFSSASFSSISWASPKWSLFTILRYRQTHIHLPHTRMDRVSEIDTYRYLGIHMQCNAHCLYIEWDPQKLNNCFTHFEYIRGGTVHACKHIHTHTHAYSCTSIHMCTHACYHITHECASTAPSNKAVPWPGLEYISTMPLHPQ